MSEYWQAIYTTVTPIIGALVVILNLLQLYFIYKFSKTGRRITLYVIYISSLSASDVMGGMVMILVKSMTPFMNVTLKHDAAAKEIYGILKHVFIRFSLFASIFNLMALTFDRLVAIKYPLIHRKWNKSFAIKVCILVWVLSLICVTAMYSISRFYLRDVGKYNNLIFPISAYPATVIFTVTYTSIYVKIRGNRLHFSNGKPTRITKKERINKSNIDGTQAGLLKRNSKEMKFLKWAVITVLVFVICWLPLSTCKLLSVGGKSCGGKNVESTFFALAFMNSLINPFIYFANIRKQLSKVQAQNPTKLHSVNQTPSPSATTTFIDTE